MRRKGTIRVVLTGGQLAGGNTATARAADDFYATDPRTVELFLDRVRPNMGFAGTIWECACGNGNISRVLERRFPLARVVSTDLAYRGYGQGGVDFLESGMQADMIITNPPFSRINQFIEHALELTRRHVIFLARVQLLEGVERKRLLESSPLRAVYVHSARQATWKNGQPLDQNGKRWATTMCLAWFVWDKAYKGEPVIRLI